MMGDFVRSSTFYNGSYSGQPFRHFPGPMRSYAQWGLRNQEQSLSDLNQDITIMQEGAQWGSEEPLQMAGTFAETDSALMNATTGAAGMIGGLVDHMIASSRQSEANDAMSEAYSESTSMISDTYNNMLSSSENAWEVTDANHYKTAADSALNKVNNENNIIANDFRTENSIYESIRAGGYALSTAFGGLIGTGLYGLFDMTVGNFFMPSVPAFHTLDKNDINYTPITVNGTAVSSIQEELASPITNSGSTELPTEMSPTPADVVAKLDLNND